MFAYACLALFIGLGVLNISLIGAFIPVLLIAISATVVEAVSGADMDNITITVTVGRRLAVDRRPGRLGCAVSGVSPTLIRCRGVKRCELVASARRGSDLIAFLVESWKWGDSH